MEVAHPQSGSWSWSIWNLEVLVFEERGKPEYPEYSFFPEVWISLKVRVDYLLCFLSFFFFFFILPGTVLSLNWEYIVFQEWWKTLSCFWKVLLKRWSLEYQGVSVVCLARSSHQSLRTYYTICITSPSKEKARTFYLFPFHWCNFF